MEARLRKRLDEFRVEHHAGRQTLADLDGQTAKPRATLLRMAGAIQVLEEELGQRAAAGESPASPPAVD